jgi:hypothetical protein
MLKLSFRCPTTHRHVETEIETDAGNLAKVWSSHMRIRCPHCNGDHEINVKDAFIENSISDETLRGSKDSLC